MSKTNDGGFAFPNAPNGCTDSGEWAAPIFPGMTLRQWYAGQAIIGIANVDERGGGSPDYKLWAANAFLLADAMLAEGAK